MNRHARIIAAVAAVAAVRRLTRAARKSLHTIPYFYFEKFDKNLIFQWRKRYFLGALYYFFVCPLKTPYLESHYGRSTYA